MDKKVIPFGKTKNVSYVLDFDDYIYALNYDGGILLGFLIVIHTNIKYPQYHNLRYDN